MPAIKFRIPLFNAASGILHEDLGTDVFGFAGTGANFKIKVGEYQDRTNILNSNSYKRHISANNVKPFGSTSGSISFDESKETQISLVRIPNSSSTMNINFGNATGATSYNVTSAYVTASGLDVLYYSNGGDVLAKPSSKRSDSVDIYMAEISHPSNSTGVIGSGSTSWSSLAYLANTSISLTTNPGPSGLYSKVGSTGIPSNTHDWYLALAIKPRDINSTPLMPFSCIIEYL